MTTSKPDAKQKGKSSGDAADILRELEKIIKERRRLSPQKSYVAEMLKGPEHDLYRKVPEEAIEVLMAALDGGAIAEEIADLWFHSLLVMSKHDITVKEVETILKRRRKT